MQLLIVRHAIAEEPAPGLSEEERALTQRGRERFERAARGLAALGLAPVRVHSSPLLRALQTAEILVAACAGELAVTELLAAPPGEELLARLRGSDAALVGHEPWVSALCAWLVAGRRELGPGFPFKKGGCALLEGEPAPGEMRLVAFLPPRVLRALARDE
jgi:phosphohistidine phosphatase